MSLSEDVAPGLVLPGHVVTGIVTCFTTSGEGVAGSDPDEIAVVLHGVLLGPIAPTIEQRQAITAPALVIGHGIDFIYSFADAKRLARQLPAARLTRTRTRTFAELWVRPARLTGEIVRFLDHLWAANEPQDPEQPRTAA